MILPEVLGRRGFQAVVEDLEAACQTSPRRWEILYAAYPRIGIGIKATKARDKLRLVIEAPDWPHIPLEVIPTDGAYGGRQLNQIPRRPDTSGVHHLSQTGDGRLWFCVYGTKSFHRLYREHVPWEAIRHLASNQPHQILEACLNCIDLDGDWP